MDLQNVEPLRRIPTGIQGFEHISLGGVVEGRTTLLVGTSGSGKTLFATELLYRSLTAGGRSAEPTRPGPYTFADVHQATAFMTEAVEALMVLGCDVHAQ